MDAHQNSRRQKVKTEASSVLRTPTQLNRLGVLAPGICAIIKHPPELRIMDVTNNSAHIDD